MFYEPQDSPLRPRISQAKTAVVLRVRNPALETLVPMTPEACTRTFIAAVSNNNPQTKDNTHVRQEWNRRTYCSLFT